MFRPSLHSFGSGLIVVLFLVLPIRATTASNWTNPSAHLPSFTSTYLVGERILLSWQPLNLSTNDLWLIRYNISNDFTLRIASALDLSQAGSFPWTIAVSEEEVEMDTRFMFAFVPTGSSYDATQDSGLDSPAFNLMMVNQNTPADGTPSSSSPNAPASPTTSSSGSQSSPSSTDTASSTSTSSNDRSHLSTGAIAGIAVGVLAAVGLACFFGGYLVFKKRLSRHTQKINADSDVPMTGPYEALGSRHAPAEMIAKETRVHEMTSSVETLAHESDGIPVHEVSNTVKRPGLHEMPG